MTPNTQNYSRASRSHVSPLQINAVSIILLLVALAMGSVHPLSEAFLQLSLISALLILIIVKYKTYLLIMRSRYFCWTVGALFTALAWAWIQSATPLDSTAHSAFLKSLVLFLTFFLLSAFSLHSKHSSIDKALYSIRLVGILICLVALSHWLQDNGKLFGYFEPNSLFSSPRARWPFVNPNNLAQFILIPLFISAEFLLRTLDKLTSHLFKRRRTRNISQTLESKSTQRSFLLFSLEVLFILIFVITLIATQSRTNLAVTLSISLFALMFFGTARGSKNRNLNNRLTYIFVFLLLCFGTLALFSVGKGAEYLQERAIGSSLSKGEMRWSMYADSLALIFANPVRGIGASNWRWSYQEIKSNDLALVDPKFLHSDPFQYLLECGIVGFAPLLLLFAFFSFLSIKFVRRHRSDQTARSFAFLFFGSLALLMSSLFDFPFRVPAVALLFACALALLCTILERSNKISS